MYRITRYLLLAVVAVAALSSCYIIPLGAYGYITVGQLRTLESLGQPIYDGRDPPDVTGSYYCGSLTLWDSNIPYDTPGVDTYYDMVVTFYSQTADGSVMVSYNQSDVEIGTGLGAFISGDGNDFTIYAQINGTYEGIDFTDAMIFSGTMTAGGIADFVYSLMLTDKDYDPYDDLIDVGDARVIEEYDGLAANYSGPFPPIWTDAAPQRSAASAR